MSTFTIYNVPAGHDPLWVAAGQNGSILYSSDATTWIEYQAPAGDVTKNQDISFGKDGAGNDGILTLPSPGGFRLSWS